MGLDIYFKRVNKIDFQFAKKKENEDNNPYDKLELEDVGYFRKVNCLLPFFGYEDDCSIHPIEKCQIEELVDTTKELLAIYGTFNTQLQLYKADLESYESDEKKSKLIHQKINNLWKPFEIAAQEKLPTTTGFFFGNTEYRECYVERLEDIVDTFTKVLDETDFDTDQILMYCWW